MSKDAKHGNTLRVYTCLEVMSKDAKHGNTNSDPGKALKTVF